MKIKILVLLISSFFLLTVTDAAILNVCAGITIAEEEIVLNPSYDGTYQLEGRQIHQGWILWSELVNDKGGILVNGTYYTINLTVVNHGGLDPTRVAAVYAGLLDGSYGVNCQFLFGPWTSSLTAVAATQVEEATTKRTMFAMHAASEDTWKCSASLPYPCTEEGNRRFKYSWGGAPTASQFFVPAVELLRIKYPKTIATFDFGNPYSKSLVIGAVQAAESNGIQLVGQFSIPSLTPNTTVYDDLVHWLKQSNPDIVAGGTYYTNCVEFLRACERNNYIPKALIVSLCLSNPGYTNATGLAGRYLMDFLTWDAKVKGPEFEESPPPSANVTYSSSLQRTFFNYFPAQRDANGVVIAPSPKVFADAYLERWGELPVDPLGDGAVIDGYILEWAITKAQSIETEAVQEVLPLIVENSFYGRLVFDVYGKNDKKTTLVTQTDLNMKNEILFPNSAIEMEVIYPIPTWEERINDATYYQTATEIAITVVTSIAIVHSLVWMVIVLWNRSHAVFRAAQPQFLLLFLFGGVLMLCGIYCWQLYVTDSGCQAMPWLFGIGFTLLVGTVFIRGARVLIIVRASNRLKRADPQLAPSFLALLALCTVTIIILIIWTAAFPLQAVLKSPDPLRPIHSYWVCHSDGDSTVLLIILLVWEGIICLLATVVAFLNRKMDRVLFNESRPLGFVAYNIAVLSILIIALQAATVGDEEALFLIRSILIIVMVLLSVLLLFVPKITMMDKGLSYMSNRAGSVHSAGKGGSDGQASVNQTHSMNNSLTSPSSAKFNSQEEPLLINIAQGETGRCPKCTTTLKNTH